MRGFESQLDNPKKQFNDIFRERDSLEPNIEEIDVPFLKPESLGRIFALHELKIQATEQLAENEIASFMKKIHDFEEDLKEQAKRGELMYGDNVIGVEDLNKFALYCILIGANFEKAMWLDFDGAPIEKFMRDIYRTDGFTEALVA